MCGISGIFSPTPVDQRLIESMVKALAHRGPDAQGTFIYRGDLGVALGHNRLSIIDLSAEANQPFTTTDGRYVIVFNGEVYNFQTLRKELSDVHGSKFRTSSDTEVVLEAFVVWGPAMASRLEGMFALAIFDQLERRLFLFRDRLGKKPLYYFQRDNLFAFASEIKSLLALPAIRQNRKINRSVISAFLHLGYIPEPHTIYQEVYKFPAGCHGELGSELMLKTTPYWSIQDKLNMPRVTNETDARKHVGLLLDQAVQKRLISDVPIGAFLSGGVDSSLVTALATKHVKTPLKTFSIGFKENKFDESVYARSVAKHLGTDHTEYMLQEREAIGLLEIYAKHFDEPFADTSAIPTMLVSQLARQEVKVVLTGDGGDELFQGYGAYKWANRLSLAGWKIAASPLSQMLRIFGNSRLQRISHVIERPRLGGIRSHIFSQEQYFFSQRELQDELLKDKTDFKPFIYEDLKGSDRLSAGERQALFDLQYYLKDDLLVKVDRASMFHALECRCPLLDYQLVEYAFSLDSSLKIKGKTQKYLLKTMLSDYLPAEWVNRPKWGFSVPLVKWLKGELRYLIDDYLSDGVIEEVGLFNPQRIRELKLQFFSGSDYVGIRLWAVIVLHKWWKENGICP